MDTTGSPSPRRAMKRTAASPFRGLRIRGSVKGSPSAAEASSLAARPLRRPYKSGAAKWDPVTDRRAAQFKLKDIRASIQKRLAQMKESLGAEFCLITIPKSGVPQTMTSTGGNPYDFFRATAAYFTSRNQVRKPRAIINITELFEAFTSSSPNFAAAEVDELCLSLAPFIRSELITEVRDAFDLSLTDEESFRIFRSEGLRRHPLSCTLAAALQAYVSVSGTTNSAAAFATPVGISVHSEAPASVLRSATVDSSPLVPTHYSLTYTSPKLGLKLSNTELGNSDRWAVLQSDDDLPKVGDFLVAVNGVSIISLPSQLALTHLQSPDRPIVLTFGSYGASGTTAGSSSGDNEVTWEHDDGLGVKEGEELWETSSEDDF